MRGEHIPETREQQNAIEALCLEHGTCEVNVTLSTAGILVHVQCEDGTHHYITEDGKERS
jgi:hypothetical protein